MVRSPHTCYDCGAQWFDSHVCPVRNTVTRDPMTIGMVGASDPELVLVRKDEWEALRAKVAACRCLPTAHIDGVVAP